MKVFHEISEAVGIGGALCLGNFDGAHLGHQALFNEARRHGTATVVTFDPHPGKVLQPELAPKLITLLPRKLELFAAAGLDTAVVQPFSREYAKTLPADFEASLLDCVGARDLVVGADFTYGERRHGTIETLQQAAQRRGARVHVIPVVTLDGVVVSSSKIREYILEGRVSAARRLLGRYFDIEGRVVLGQGRGRTIGFPTANVETPNELRPAPGVYAVRVRVKDEDGTARPRAGAANIGVKPTFGGGEVTIEIHLLDFTGDLYGKELRVEFLDRLRAEQRFASVAELAGQIHRDVEAAREASVRAFD